MIKATFPEDNPEHPNHDAAVAKAWAGDKRKHDNLRVMVEKACEGLLPHVQDRIKDAARRAYYIGCTDGMQLKQQELERKRGAA